MANVIIIGSGPAGVSAALYTARAGLETTVLSMGIGSLGKAEAIENYYGFSAPISGQALAEAGIEGAKRVGVTFETGQPVSLSFNDKLTVETLTETRSADFVVLATGSARAVPRIDGIREFEGKGVSYCAVCDAFFYRGKNVCVLGSGEQALHEIAALQPIAASVTLVTNGESLSVSIPTNVAVNSAKISCVAGAERVEEIQFSDGTSLATDGLFVAYGVAGSTALARKIGAQIDANRIVVDENMATSIPGLFAVGDCTGGLLQVSKAVYEGAKAGTEIAKAARRSKA